MVPTQAHSLCWHQGLREISDLYIYICVCVCVRARAHKIILVKVQGCTRTYDYLF